MTIKNADGTTFQLVKPNPLMKNQEQEGEAKLHNFGEKQEVVIRYVQKRQPVQPNGAVYGKLDPLPHVEHQLVAPTPPPKPVDPPTFKVPEPTPPPVQEENEEFEALKKTAWCMPGSFKDYRDDTYGEVRRVPVFGDKFMLELIVLDQSEVAFKIWTQVNIKSPSVIFIQEDRRWWRVSDTKPDKNGFVLTCLPSDVRPRFD